MFAPVRGNIVSLQCAIDQGCGNDCGCGNVAVSAIVVESDSFGCEYAPICENCKHEYKASVKQERGKCDWCKRDNLKLHPTRDYSEGYSGCVYDVCSTCISKQNEEFNDFEDEYDPEYERNMKMFSRRI